MGAVPKWGIHLCSTRSPPPLLLTLLDTFLPFRPHSLSPSLLLPLHFPHPFSLSSSSLSLFLSLSPFLSLLPIKSCSQSKIQKGQHDLKHWPYFPQRHLYFNREKHTALKYEGILRGKPGASAKWEDWILES